MSEKVDYFSGVALDFGKSCQIRWPKLWAEESIPTSLWQELGSLGFLGLSAPQSFGGQGMSVEDIAHVSRVFARSLGVQGLIMAVQSHNLMADWILGKFGSPQQQNALWPKIAKGEATIAFAVSEKDAGAHPKKLSSTAVRAGDGWRLNGQKAYVTNGPIASVFCIVAVAEKTDVRSKFQAFLVPRESSGLEIFESEEVKYLKPSGHSSLSFKNLYVPDSACLTNLEDVYPNIVKPLRDHEDAASVRAQLGAYERIANSLARYAKELSIAGKIAARLRAIALCLDHDCTAEGLLAARAVLSDVSNMVRTLMAENSGVLGEGDTVLAYDLIKLGKVASYAIDARFTLFGNNLRYCT